MDFDLLSNVHENNANVTKYQHSNRISTRRRALFPSILDDNSDLGPISPLSDSNQSESHVISDKKSKTFKDYFSSFRNNTNDYIAIGDKIIEDELENNTNYPSASSFSPINQQSISIDLQKTIIPDTPLKESPTKNLKTPHDMTSCSVKIPKLIRKHNGEALHSIESGNHNFSPTNLPPSKIVKLNTSSLKTSKVRTALFPDITLSVQSFYPKSDEKNMGKSLKMVNSQEKKSKKKLVPLYLCNRRQSTRNRFGQINGGVSHKIRKPKQKVPAKISAKKAVMGVAESSYLIEYVKELNDISNIRPKLIKALDNKQESNANISNLNNLDTGVKYPEGARKKFFKTDVHRNAGTSELEKKNKTSFSDKINLSTLDFVNDEQELVVPSLDKIFDTLDEENMFPSHQVGINDSYAPKGIPSSTKIILKASNTINDSENSILFHHSHEHSKYTNCKERKRKLDDKENESIELMLSPTSQMCDMASGLAINSPKRAKLNITNIFEKSEDTNKSVNIFNRPSSALDMDKEKLFPIFYPSQNCTSDKELRSTAKSVAFKKWKSLPAGQMLLDAGQKRFGFTQCTECEIIYHMGDPGDEMMHNNYHTARSVLSFKGWKNENLVGCLPDARIIKIRPGDSKMWWKKVRDLVEVINRDLGYYEMELNVDDSVVFLYIKDKSIVGCITAEQKNEAYKMLSSFEGIDICSTSSYPAKCGVSRIWVSQNNRKQGIGTALMDCLRTNFTYGYVLRRDEIAVSSPTELGKMFATKYFETENFLIYTS